jgi:putative endonuclease
MSYFVYIIQSKKDGRFYIGSTNNLTERVERHNQGRSRYTKSRGPWELVYKEEHHDRSTAMKKEKEIKNRKSRQFIESLVRTSRQ